MFNPIGRHFFRASVLALLLLAFFACSGGSSGSSGASSYDGTVVGAQGGTVASDDGRLALTVPAGAITSDTRIAIRAIDTSSTALSDLDPVLAYDMSPDGLTLAVPARVSITLPDPAPEPGEQIELSHLLVTESGDTIETAANQMLAADSKAGTLVLSGDIEHFSYMEALYSRA